MADTLIFSLTRMVDILTTFQLPYIEVKLIVRSLRFKLLDPWCSCIVSIGSLCNGLVIVVQEMVTVSVDASVLDRIAKIMSYLRLGSSGKVLKKKKKERDTKGNSHLQLLAFVILAFCPCCFV